MSLWVIGLLVVLALLFDFMNGFHDAANSIATVVSTGVLKPQPCRGDGRHVQRASRSSCSAPEGGGHRRQGHDRRQTSSITTSSSARWSAPSRGTSSRGTTAFRRRSSHALIGGLVGAAVAKAGTGALVGSGLIKTVAFILISPLLGLRAGLADDGGGGLDVLRARRRRAWTAGSAACSWCRRRLYSLGHGGNDAQKTIGIIWMLLIATGHIASGGLARRSG